MNANMKTSLSIPSELVAKVRKFNETKGIDRPIVMSHVASEAIRKELKMREKSRR